MKFACSAILVLALTGCDRATSTTSAGAPSNPATEAAPASQSAVAAAMPHKPASVPFQRFVPLPESPGNPLIMGVPRPWIALDTVTGQLCSTVIVVPENPTEAQREWLRLPPCLGLSTNLAVMSFVNGLQ